MATPEEAIAKALNIPAAGIQPVWDNDPSSNWLILPYDGDPGISQEVIVVEVKNINQGP